MDNVSFAVIGAGAGGQSMSAILADKGYYVKVYDNNKDLVEELNSLEKIILKGKYNLSAKPDLITDDIKKAIENVDVIMIVTTADAHECIAKNIAKIIKKEQIVVLNPGFLGGSLAFKKALKDNYCPYDITVAETVDLMYTCRKVKVGEVLHSGLKKRMELAALPSSKTTKVLEVLKPVFPILVPSENVLLTGLKNFGPIIHCIPMIMNINKIDFKLNFEYYMEGITPSIAKIAESIDLERIEIAKAFGFKIPSVVDSISAAYGIDGANLYDIIKANKAYEGIKAPVSLEHRFLSEDTFAGLVPLVSIGEEIGASVTGMKAIVDIISIVTGIDYLKEGRTAEKIGVAGYSIEEIKNLVS